MSHSPCTTINTGYHLLRIPGKRSPTALALTTNSQYMFYKVSFIAVQIQYAKSGASDVKDSLEEKYEIAQAKMIHYWKEINADMDPNEKEAVVCIHTFKTLAHILISNVRTRTEPVYSNTW